MGEIVGLVVGLSVGPDVGDPVGGNTLTINDLDYQHMLAKNSCMCTKK